MASDGEDGGVSALQRELDAAFARRRGWCASEVLAGKLYLGSGADAQQGEQMRALGVTDVLNVADDVPNYHTDFAYTNLHVADFGLDRGIARVFPEATSLIGAVLASDTRKVLVHCAAGQNRSVTIVIAALMQLENLTLRQAYGRVLHVRPKVCPLKDNRQALLDHEHALYGTNTMGRDDFAHHANLRSTANSSVAGGTQTKG